MALYKNLAQKNASYNGKSINVNELIHKARHEEKKEKFYTLVTAIVSVSILVISGFIIAL